MQHFFAVAAIINMCIQSIKSVATLEVLSFARRIQAPAIYIEEMVLLLWGLFLQRLMGAVINVEIKVMHLQMKFTALKTKVHIEYKYEGLNDLNF